MLLFHTVMILIAPAVREIGFDAFLAAKNRQNRTLPIYVAVPPTHSCT